MDINKAVLVFDSPDDRTLLLKEADADPIFAKRLQVTLAFPDGEKRVALSARKAVANELDPHLYPETRGSWRRLRAVVRDLIAFTSDSIRGSSISEKIREVGVSNLGELGELGQWDIIGQVVGAVVQAGASVYTAYNQQQATKQIQQMQLNAQMQQIQAQENIAKAQAAINSAQTGLLAPVKNAVASVADMASTPVMGVPLWVIAIGLYLFAEKA
jgi:hypothetical protein